MSDPIIRRNHLETRTITIGNVDNPEEEHTHWLSLDPIIPAFAIGTLTSASAAWSCLNFCESCGTSVPIDPGTVVILTGIAGGLNAIHSLPINIETLKLSDIVKTSAIFGGLVSTAVCSFTNFY